MLYRHITIRPLASGETIRSARFLGDTGYFVTFRQTDPLFRVDLSDPASPKITGELKISGFSSYLHFYGENLLLGIGYEANETTGETTGIKLSMFDLSDPDEIREVNRIVIPGITWAPAIDDYKSILVDAEKNLIGFYCDGRYLVYSYDSENGFDRMLVYDCTLVIRSIWPEMVSWFHLILRTDAAGRRCSGTEKSAVWAAYQEWLVPLLIQSSPHPLLIAPRSFAGELPDSVKSRVPFSLLNRMPCVAPSAHH